MESLYIGATFTHATDYLNYLTPAESRIRQDLKTPATIEKHLSERREKDEQESPMKPFTGVLSSIHVDSETSNNVFTLHKDNPQRGDVALPFLNWLLENFRDNFGGSVFDHHDAADGKPTVALYGFGIKDLLWQAGIEVHYLNARSSDPRSIPPRLMKHVRGTCDPADWLLRTQAEVTRIGYDNLFAFYHIATTWNDICRNPAALAQVAKVLVEKANIG